MNVTRRALAALAVGMVVVAAGLPAGASSASTKSYIVVFEDSVTRPGAIARAQVERLGGSVTHVYRHALPGYSAELPAAAVTALRADVRVDFVEADSAMHASGSQTNAPWGLDRTDQRARPLNGTYNYTATGAGVTAYVIDTGIRLTHAQFGGRAVSGVDYVDGGTAADCDGHGTHVAGTVGGSTYGIAKSVTLVAVRVLDCAGSGYTSDVIAGVDWVTGHHVGSAPAVANMSLGGGASSALDTAVSNSINDGVSYAVAAGNGNIVGVAQDACKSSPARVGAAITIGATNSSDQKASWSNYGACVDFFAPGVSIVSAGVSGDTATATMSGTSMAAPHVAGVAALYLQNNTSASPATVRNALYDLTTKGIVTSSKTTNNHLLYSNL